jgi:hypothetical protein
MGEKWPKNFPESGDFHVTFGFFFACRKARHETDGFTSPPKEGVLRIISPEKSDGFGLV